MAKQTLEERIEAIESWQRKINGYGLIAMGACGAASVIFGFLTWVVNLLAKHFPWSH